MTDKESFADRIKNERGDIFSTHPVTSFRVWLKVCDVMSRDVVTIQMDSSVVNAARKMAEYNVSCIVVVNNGNVLGIITETDLLKKISQKDKDRDMRVLEIMSCPVESIGPATTILEASQKMRKRRFAVLW